MHFLKPPAFFARLCTSSWSEPCARFPLCLHPRGRTAARHPEPPIHHRNSRPCSAGPGEAADVPAQPWGGGNKASSQDPALGPHRLVAHKAQTERLSTYSALTPFLGEERWARERKGRAGAGVGLEGSRGRCFRNAAEKEPGRPRKRSPGARASPAPPRPAPSRAGPATALAWLPHGRGKGGSERQGGSQSRRPALPPQGAPP